MSIKKYPFVVGVVILLLAAITLFGLLPTPVTVIPVMNMRGESSKHHQEFIEIAKRGDVDLLLLGDSITDGWRHNGRAIYAQNFEPLKAANFGVEWDRTQHLLWRLQNGELDGIKPRVCMLLIGTNNSSNSVEDVVSGITAVVEVIHTKLPDTKILLLGILPRGERPNLERDHNDKVNQTIARLDNGTGVKYLDIGKSFLNEDLSISKDVMPDFLHLSPVGYSIWAREVLPTITELISK